MTPMTLARASETTRTTTNRARETSARSRARRAVPRARTRRGERGDEGDAEAREEREEGDEPVKMARVSRERVLESCAKTSMGMLVVGLVARAASGAVPMAATGGNWNETLPLLGNGDANEVALGALAAATAVTLGRIALLQVWEEFAASTDRSNAQVLGALEGAGDVAQVAVLPALGEEVLFRGALLPAIGGIPGVAVSSVVFGALHVGGGRSAAFGIWATAVGACYGACALHTGSVVAPAAAHALANIASAAYWNATRAEKKALLVEEKAEEE